MRMTRRNTRGFTLIELMVVIAIIAALAAILLPVIGSLLESARARACQKKLSTFSTGFAAYKDKNQNKLPSLFRVGDPGMTLSTSTLWGSPDDRMSTTDATKAIAMRTALGSNAAQNFWLLLSGEYIGGGEDAFKCPNDSGWKARNIPQTAIDNKLYQFGWTDPKNFSYGYQFPYSVYQAGAPVFPTTATGSTGTATISWPELPDLAGQGPSNYNWADPGGIIASNAGPDGGKAMYPDNCIILADRNPRTAPDSPTDGKLTVNSNHEEGLCYVQKGGSSDFYKGVDGKAGFGKDDIYNSRASTGGTVAGVPRFSGGGQSDTDDSMPFDTSGNAKFVCTDTVIWPFDARSR